MLRVQHRGQLTRNMRCKQNTSAHYASAHEQTEAMYQPLWADIGQQNAGLAHPMYTNTVPARSTGRKKNQKRYLIISMCNVQPLSIVCISGGKLSVPISTKPTAKNVLVTCSFAPASSRRSSAKLMELRPSTQIESMKSSLADPNPHNPQTNK